MPDHINIALVIVLVIAMQLAVQVTAFLRWRRDPVLPNLGEKTRTLWLIIIVAGSLLGATLFHLVAQPRPGPASPTSGTAAGENRREPRTQARRVTDLLYR